MTTDLVLLSLNCGKALQSSKAFEKLVTKALPQQEPSFCVVAVQEAAPIVPASFSVLETYVEGIRSGTSGALTRKYPGKQYSLVGESWAGAIGLLVYFAGKVDEARSTSTSFGMLWSSLKGAAAVRVTIRDTKYTFVSAHLAANEGFAEARNNNYALLANGLKFNGQSLYLDEPNHLFVLGDLNYRALKDVTGSSDEDTEQLMGSGYSAEIDELAIEKDAGRTLWGLAEAKINFAPTFKFHFGRSVYNKKRIPSWCDRILYSDLNAHVTSYSSVPAFTGSDHKPVYLQVSVSSQPTLAHADIPNTVPASHQLTAASDTVVGSAMYLGTTSIGWGILATLGLLLIYYAL